MLGDSLDDRINRAAALAAKLMRKGAEGRAREIIDRWRTEPLEPVVLVAGPAQFGESDRSELDFLHDMLTDIREGRGTLDPRLAHGTKTEQSRYYAIENVLERTSRWGPIVSEVEKRAGL